MTYQFNNELVKEEKWKWVAIYKDDTILKQFDDDGNFHQFKEIDIDNLALWRITDGVRNIDIPMNPGMKPIHFYQRKRSKTMGSDVEQQSTVYCFGYENTQSEETDKLIYMIFENDFVVMTRDTNPVVDVGYLRNDGQKPDQKG